MEVVDDIWNLYIIKSRKEMKDAIDMDRKYYDTQNDLFMKRTNDHLVQIKKYMYCLRHEQYYISKNNKLHGDGYRSGTDIHRHF